MKVQPLGDRILILVSEAKKTTASGLHIPDTAQEKAQTGSIIAIGESDEIHVKVGQRVMFDKYAGTSVSINDTDHLIIKSKDLLAIVEE